MRISDWSSDVCSSDLFEEFSQFAQHLRLGAAFGHAPLQRFGRVTARLLDQPAPFAALRDRSEEHTSELQSLMRISYAVFCLKKQKAKENTHKRYSTRPRRKTEC